MPVIGGNPARPDPFHTSCYPALVHPLVLHGAVAEFGNRDNVPEVRGLLERRTMFRDTYRYPVLEAIGLPVHGGAFSVSTVGWDCVVHLPFAIPATILSTLGEDFPLFGDIISLPQTGWHDLDAALRALRVAEIQTSPDGRDNLQLHPHPWMEYLTPERMEPAKPKEWKIVKGPARRRSILR